MASQEVALNYKDVTIMAVIVDVGISQSVFQDVYGASGVSPGSEMVLKNKSRSDPILIVIAETVPDSSITAGYEIEPRETVIIPVNSEGVWARSTTNTTLFLNVQQSPGIRPAVGVGVIPDIISKDTEALLASLDTLNHKITHLNMMFDEAFETSITEEDI